MLLVGPKAVGKTWVAQNIAQLGVEYLDVDAFVLDLLAHGEHPDSQDGWLRWVEPAVDRALAEHDVVSVEATGAWESDYRLGEHLERRGHRVVRVWVTASEEESIARLNARTTSKVPVDEAEARRIYSAATLRARRECWDAMIDTAGAPDAELPVRVLGPPTTGAGG